MGTRKVYDVAVVVGKYSQNGQEKNKYKTVGAMLEKDDGGRFLTLDRSFNPAGVPFREGSDSIMLSLFEPREQAPGGYQQQAAAQAPAARPHPTPTPGQPQGPAGMADFDDDIPF